MREFEVAVRVRGGAGIRWRLLIPGRVKFLLLRMAVRLLSGNIHVHRARWVQNVPGVTFEYPGVGPAGPCRRRAARRLRPPARFCLPNM